MAFLIRPKTTALVLAAFTKVVDELRRVHDAHVALADKHEEAAADSLMAAEAARREAKSASAALEHFSKIPGVSA
jgi:hypothetical protein